MANIFPLKAIMEARAARFLQDVIDLDTPTPRAAPSVPSMPPMPPMSTRRSTSIMSERSFRSYNSDYTEDGYEKKSRLIYCLGIIIEDAVDQMHILSFGKKADRCLEKFKMSLEGRIAEMMYEDPIYDMESGDPYEVALTRRKLNKNLQDCAICKEFLGIIKNEIRNDKTYSSVRDIMNTIIQRKQAEAKLLQDEMTNYTKMKNLKHMLMTHSRDYQVQMHKVNEILATAEDRSQELLFENLLRVRYIKNWEKARREQNSLSCKKNEQEMEDIITKYQNEIEKEIRVHSEITNFINENLTDLDTDIKYWMARYYKEMESRNIEIQIIRDRKEEQEKNHQNLRDLFALHKKQIEDFLAYKERKKWEDALKERQRAAALKIQAWWRGQMVRHQLGPYNPKRKGKKGKGKGKDKNKKQKK